jgi:uncharacterized protein (DUF1684 family)
MTGESERPADVGAHRAHVEAMRARREAGLRDPEGWLSLVGLHWLHEGDNRVGGDPASEVPLTPSDGTDASWTVAWIQVRDGAVLLRPAAMPAGADAAELSVDGVPVDDELPLVDDSEGTPTVLALGELRFHLVRRGGRLGIRVRDRAAPALAAFNGIDSFPIDPAWRVIGRFVPADPGRTIPVPDVLGDLNDEPSPGDVELLLGGEVHRLRALEAVPGHLWLVFGDATNGQETYAGGRFLVTGPIEDDGSVEVDFNLAYNPPCVFSPFATCPLPPEGNRLAIRVEAGERSDGHRERPGPRVDWTP